jgi:hypothetical protein
VLVFRQGTEVYEETEQSLEETIRDRRDTVTRIADFRKRGIVRICGAGLIIRDKAELENCLWHSMGRPNGESQRERVAPN